MRAFVVLFVFFACSIAGSAQGVSDITFAQSGSTIVVSYKISIPPDRTASTALFVSTDGGKTFQGPLKSVTGDVGAISGSGSKKIVWRVFDEMSSLEGDIVFEVRASYEKIPGKKESFVMYTLSGTSALGITYGKVAELGWYGRLKTNGKFAQGDFSTNDAKLLDYTGSGYYTYTDEVNSSRFALTGGVLYRLSNNMYLFAGGGYGTRQLFWKVDEFSYTNDTKTGEFWAQHVDRSASGVEIETGLILRVGKMNFSLGLNTVNFGFYEINGGFGIFL